MALYNVFRCSLKVVSWLITVGGRSNCSEVRILMYHRVTGDTQYELDVRYQHFAAQMKFLAENATVVSLDSAIDYINGSAECADPVYVITFDDAYEDFYHKAMPLLRRYKLPATLYVTTDFINNSNHVPLSKNINGYLMPSVNWNMLKEIANSGLVTIGGHTHTHKELPSLKDSDVFEEISICDSLIYEKLNLEVAHFAYPRGAWSVHVEGLISSKYKSVVLAGGGAVSKDNNLNRRLPRVPILQSDGIFWFKSRINGRLRFEEMVVAMLKNLKYSIRKILIGWYF